VAAPQSTGPALTLRRLHPQPDTITVGELTGSLELSGPPDLDRPYTLVNFITSADGRAAFQGRSGPLGDEGDRALFHGLRERVDAVLAGTGTVRAERYGRLVGDPERRRRREQAGLSPEPLACMITRSGDVPTDIPLFAEPDARIAIFSPQDVDASRCAAHLETVRLDPGELTLTTMMRRLRSDFDVRSLLCEGGPTIFGALLQERLVDELFLTVAPKLVGGGPGPTIASGPELPELEPLELNWVLERGGSLFLRYGLR
jgi:riboflavin-specific deaminase-like protein